MCFISSGLQGFTQHYLVGTLSLSLSLSLTLFHVPCTSVCTGLRYIDAVAAVAKSKVCLSQRNGDAITEADCSLRKTAMHLQ